MVMRRFGVRAPAAPSAPSRGEENAPPFGGGSSATASRPPLRAIQPRLALAASSRKPQRPVPAPSRGPGARAAAAKAPPRWSASLAPARSLRKPAPPRLGHATTGAASSPPVFQPLKVREEEALAVAHHHCSDGYGDPELHTFKFIDSEVSPLDTNLKEEALALKELEIQMELLKVEASAAAALWCREREVWEQSTADLEVDVSELEKRVKTMKEEVEYQKRGQGKIEVQLQDLLRVHEKCLINQAEKTLRQNKELEKLRCQLEDKTAECLHLQTEVSELKQLLSQAKAFDQAGLGPEVKANATWDGKAARRKYMKWSHFEEDALRKGVDKFEKRS